MNDPQIDKLIGSAYAVDEKPSLELSRRLAETSAPEIARSAARHRLAVGFAFGLAIVAVAGAAVHLRPQREFCTFNFDQYGQIEMSGFCGTIFIDTPGGQTLGQTGSPDPAGQETVVRLDGVETKISGLGQHAIRDRQGRVRFIVDMQNRTNGMLRPQPLPTTVTEIIDTQKGFFKRRTEPGVASIPYMVIGGDPEHDVFWSVEGPVEVVWRVKGKKFEAGASWPKPGAYRGLGITEDYSPSSVPVLSWQVGAMKYASQGFGEHILLDGQGNEFGRIDISKIGDTQP